MEWPARTPAAGRGWGCVIKGVVFDEITNAKEFLIKIEKGSAKNDKVETSTLLLRVP